MSDQSMVVNLLVEPETGSILYVSSGASDFYGYTIDQLKAMNISDITPLSVREIGETIGHSGYLQIIALKIRRPSGELHNARAYASFMTANRSKSLFLCIFNQKPEEAYPPPASDSGFLPDLSFLLNPEPGYLGAE